MTEADFLSNLQQKLHRRGLAKGNGVITGIGDDCAIFRARGSSSDLVFTADMMHEGVHFTWDQPPESVGHRALTRSLSDCAAMGAKPLFSLVSLAFPAEAGAWADAFYDGFLRLARKHQVVLAGGDLSNTRSISCDVTVCGEVPRGSAMLRSNAKSGDVIYVSGALGKAALALDTRTEFSPRPRLEIGEALRTRGCRACIDLSDGLSIDLHRLCLASGVSADLDNIPIARGAHLQHALHGGEDYQLLFTLRPGAKAPKGCLPIGTIQKGLPSRVTLHGQPLQPQGWDHFSR